MSDRAARTHRDGAARRARSVLAAAWLLAAGTTAAQPDEPTPDAVVPAPAPFTLCDEDNRGAVCTQQYEPVCGAVDTGLRCVTEPCESTRYHDFGNACEACADAAVQGFTPGPCATP